MGKEPEEKPLDLAIFIILMLTIVSMFGGVMIMIKSLMIINTL